MPPRNIFTKEQIVEAGLTLVRQSGMEALTARSLAQALGTSTKPIFGLFSSMQELQEAVLAAADTFYQSHIAEAMAEGRYPVYKASGMAYIEFARQEPALFKLLFMRDRSGETIGEDRQSIAPILQVIQANLGVDENTAYRFHLEMWLYVHGVATMLATNYLPWDTDFISESLTDLYQGLSHRFKENAHGSH